MRRSIPSIPLGELLIKTDDWIDVHPTVTYREVTVRLWGKGVVLRREAAAGQIKAARRLRVRAGQFILSRIDARNGAFDLIPDELDGAVVSNDFPTFSVREDRLLPEFLGWMSKTKTFVDLCRAASEGTTNRVRLKEDRFLAMNIPLPPLSEQRQIVAKIEQLAAKIDEAHRLRHRADMGVVQLLSSGIGRVFAELSREHEVRPFGSFSPHVTSGPRSWAKHYTEDGHRFYRAQDVGPHGEILDDSKVFIDPPLGKQGRTAMLEPGDLMIVITGATVGRCTLFRENHEPGFVSQHVAICRLPKRDVFPEYALWGLLGPGGQEQLLGQRYGQGKPGLNLTNIRSLGLPWPPLDEQRRIVAYLDNLQTKVDRLKSLQAQTATELDALLPSILDKAFKGEL